MIGRPTRYQIAAGPGVPNRPRAARIDMPFTNGQEESPQVRPSIDPGPEARPAYRGLGRQSFAWVLIFSTVALTTTTPRPTA